MQKNKKEDGVHDMLGSLFIVLFVFFMLFVYIGFSESVSMKLNCDNIAKTYLYRMEAAGYLTTGEGSDFEEMEQRFRSIGATITDIGTTKTQVPYGKLVTLHILVKFPNPLSKHVTLDLLEVPDTVEYEIKLEATAKW